MKERGYFIFLVRRKCVTLLSITIFGYHFVQLTKNTGLWLATSEI